MRWHNKTNNNNYGHKFDWLESENYGYKFDWLSGRSNSGPMDSINLLEWWVIRLGLKDFQKILKDQNVLIETDNCKGIHEQTRLHQVPISTQGSKCHDEVNGDKHGISESHSVVA